VGQGAIEQLPAGLDLYGSDKLSYPNHRIPQRGSVVKLLAPDLLLPTAFDPWPGRSHDQHSGLGTGDLAALSAVRTLQSSTVSPIAWTVPEVSAVRTNGHSPDKRQMASRTVPLDVHDFPA